MGDYLRETQAEMLDLLVRHEERIARLYQLYAERFPEEARRWSGVARQEETHAERIREWAARWEAGKAELSEVPFESAPVRVSMEFLSGAIREAEAGTPSLEEGVGVAIDVENTFIDREFFRIFESASPDGIDLRRKLVDESEAHRTLFLRWREELSGSS